MQQRRLSEIECAWQARLHEHARLLCSVEALVERHPVWAARYLVTIITLECEYARRRMLEAHHRGRRVEFYSEGLAFIQLSKILLRIARSLGHSGVPPQESLLAVVDEGGQLDEENARTMLRAGLEQIRHAPDAWVTLQQLILTDQAVSRRDKNEAAAAVKGLVRAKINGALIRTLEADLKREDHDLADLLGAAAVETLVKRRPGEGLDAVRSKTVNALRREFYKGGKSTELVEGATRDGDAEYELVAFAEHERLRQTIAWLKQMMVEAGLSPNQQEVFLMVSEGSSNTQIAQRTGRKRNQIDQEKHQALKKMRLHPDFSALGRAIL